jgi:hypothetical protein
VQGKKKAGLAARPFLPFYFFTFKLVLIKSILATWILRITARVVAATAQGVEVSAIYVSLGEP